MNNNYTVMVTKCQYCGQNYQTSAGRCFNLQCPSNHPAHKEFGIQQLQQQIAELKNDLQRHKDAINVSPRVVSFLRTEGRKQEAERIQQMSCNHKQRVTDMGDYICSLSKQKGNDEGCGDDICDNCDEDIKEETDD